MLEVGNFYKYESQGYEVCFYVQSMENPKEQERWERETWYWVIGLEKRAGDECLKRQKLHQHNIVCFRSKKITQKEFKTVYDKFIQSFDKAVT